MTGTLRTISRLGRSWKGNAVRWGRRSSGPGDTRATRMSGEAAPAPLAGHSRPAARRRLPMRSAHPRRAGGRSSGGSHGARPRWAAPSVPAAPWPRGGRGGRCRRRRAPRRRRGRGSSGGSPPRASRHGPLGRPRRAHGPSAFVRSRSAADDAPAMSSRASPLGAVGLDGRTCSSAKRRARLRREAGVGARRASGLTPAPCGGAPPRSRRRAPGSPARSRGPSSRPRRRRSAR